MGVLLTVAYDGTDYNGWQVQKNGTTVCGLLEGALAGVLAGRSFSILGASRTDAGVHALGQRVHLRTDGTIPIPLDRLPNVINAALPRDVAVTAAISVPDSFHPISDAKSKTYIYKIHNQPHRCPLRCRYSAFIPNALDFAAMQPACRHFVGEFDFAAFCATGSPVKSTVRRINFLEVSQQEQDGLLEMRVNGNGFLYNMVRIIAGTLVGVGLNKILPDDIPAIIAGKDRAKAGKTMPPQGLTLLEVFY
ncbi:MAG: tRNA pseudouridine(38-40) synthase TruA [Defluviitaleaceae bacterium]|nr:tRNA pseudouridine(38-40) synthase TruA [Defluviitaleaceae bacterium]